MAFMRRRNILLAVLSVFFFFTLSAQVTGDTLPTVPLLIVLKTTHHKSSVSRYLNAKKWNELFPNRYGKGNNKFGPIDFYSFKALETAASLFPSFLNEGDESTRKRELAAFLANIAQETSGGWASAPGGYFKWGLYYLEEKPNNQPLAYTDTSKKNYPPVAGKLYYGRGPKQLSWNYNYGQFSEAWFGTKDSLLLHPELLTKDPVLSFASAIWFWMTAQHPKPSCHDIITGKWQPTQDDIQNGRLPGFGATVNVINGGVECGSGTDLQQTKYRYEYYSFFCNYFHVDPGPNVSCANQKQFGVQITAASR
jgi:basic endochitinase B